MKFSIRLVVDVVTNCNTFRISSFTKMSYLLTHLMSVLLAFFMGSQKRSHCEPQM